MKLSLKFREETQHQNPLLRAKIPIAILGLPFLSGVVAGDSSDLSFSLRSNFSSGPTLSLSYHPTLPTATGIFPFSVSLKSGIGVFGSPHDSPLIFTAKFNVFSSANPSPNPSSLSPIFSLQVKPQFGNFSLFKSVSSSSLSPVLQLNGHSPNGNLSNGSVPDFEISNGLGHGSVSVAPEKPLAWRDLKKGSSYREILSGILVAARTSMPLTKRAMVNFRWGVNLPSDNNNYGTKTSLPVLVINKISLERVDEMKKVENEKRAEEGKAGELGVLKGMCIWMRREVEELKTENMEMKRILEGMRPHAPSSRGRRDEREVAGKRVSPPPAVEGLSGFEKWRSKKSGGNGGDGVEENGHRESKKLSEVESELQKAIMAASS